MTRIDHTRIGHVATECFFVGVLCMEGQRKLMRSRRDCKTQGVQVDSRVSRKVCREFHITQVGEQWI